MKRFSTVLMSVFVLFALFGFNTAKADEIVAEEQTVTQETTTVEQDLTKLKNRVEMPSSSSTAAVPAEYKEQAASDVPEDYWAATEINACIKEGIIPLFDDGTFDPEAVVKRVDFATWILNALENSTFLITVHSKYSDVDEQTPGYEAILRNDQIGLIYGYPDGTFQPERIITKAETNSIMSHITKDFPIGESVLNSFSDSDEIPVWARHTYEKTVKYGLYVNHPDSLEFLPNKQLNRAEAAVLLYKLRRQLDLVKKAYKAERILGTEHLNVTPLAPANTVQVTDQRLIVDAGNVIKVAFANRFNSKNYHVGDEVHFYAKDDIKTVEGTTVFPQGTKFLAAIETLQDPRWLNKNARMTISFKTATFPDGKCVDMVANAFENEGVLVSNHWQKPALWTLGGAAIGTGISLAVGVPKHRTGTAIAIGIPSGALGGAAIGFLTPGVNFGADQGDEIYVIIREAFSIYTVSPDDND